MSLARRFPLALLGFLAFIATAMAAPAVTLAPVVGPPTTNITVKGTGFGAIAAVDIFFDTSDLCLALATSGGAINCVIKAPASAQPQRHWISAVQRVTGTGAQKAFTVRTDWAQFHGLNAAHNGRNLFENTITTVNVGDLDTLWTAPIAPTGTESTPAIFAGKVYIAGDDGKLYAFNSLTGAAIAGFPKTLGGAIFPSSPAVGNGNVYIGTYTPDNKLHAFNATTGAAVAGFPIQLGGAVTSSPALALGNVYVGSYDHNLYAFNARTGVPVTGFPKTLANAVAASPTIANGRVYVGDLSGQFHAFDALTGTELAGSPKLAVANYGAAAVAGSAVYVGSLGGVLSAFNDTLELTGPGFPVTVGDWIYGSPAVSGGLVFIGAIDHKLYAFRTTTGGAPRWTAALDSEVRGSPVVADNIVFVNSKTRLFALSAATGEILWSAGVRTEGLNSPAVADGVVYLGSSNGNLYAYSVNGVAPAAKLAGGALGVKPAITMLKPDLSLKPVHN